MSYLVPIVLWRKGKPGGHLISFSFSFGLDPAGSHQITLFNCCFSFLHSLMLPPQFYCILPICLLFLQYQSLDLEVPPSLVFHLSLCCQILWNLRNTRFRIRRKAKVRSFNNISHNILSRKYTHQIAMFGINYG